MARVQPFAAEKLNGAARAALRSRAEDLLEDLEELREDAGKLAVAAGQAARAEVRATGARVSHLRDDRSVAIHCRIGVGRSALVAACVLGALGQSLEAAWQSIQQARKTSVPDTPEQRSWVTSFSSDFVKRRVNGQEP